MGIKKGVTLIVGGGFHGKSTLLNAIEKGIYNHIPGDGREFVSSDPTALKIRAEDGWCFFLTFSCIQVFCHCEDEITVVRHPSSLKIQIPV